MDIFAFIHTLDPTKVRVVKREQNKDEPQLLDTPVGRIVPLLPVAPDRADSELEASVVRLFDEGGSGTQTEQGDFTKGGPDANIQPVIKAVNTVVEDATPVLLAGAVLNAEVRVTAVPTLPFVTAFVSTTLEHEDGDHTNSMAEPNLHTIWALQRFIISSDSSHHSGPTIAKAEVTSIVSVTNGSRLDDGHVCREMVDEFAPPKFFASICGMEHDHLITEFNVGAARQMSLSVEVRMRAEYNVKERMRLKSVVEKHDELLKARDGEIENLKAQLLLQEKEGAKATRLHLEALVVGKKRDMTDYNAHLTSVKSQNDNLADQVHELEISSAKLQEKITVYDNWAAISRAIEKGMQSGLAADIDHGREGRSLAYLVAYNPDTEADFNSALQKFREVDFPLLVELKSHRDVSMEDIMNVLRLKGAIVDAPGMNDLHLDIERLKVPIHRSEDQVVIGETFLSFALSVLHSRVERIRENIAAQWSALVGVWTPLSEPLSVTSLMGEASTYGVVPTAFVTTTALSTTFTFASSILPIATDGYEIVGVDGQEGAGTNGRAVADRNVAPFPNVDDVELNIPQ
uniref:Transposase (Putative), gypsy type n=1 Tax=Tanacetum cinerariifolium TaxID=118510 RepID=A0A699JCT4_TANCI|nr:hypothetical protein [Tanacetum cinerariifolium]